MGFGFYVVVLFCLILICNMLLLLFVVLGSGGGGGEGRKRNKTKVAEGGAALKMIQPCKLQRESDGLSVLFVFDYLLFLSLMDIYGKFKTVLHRLIINHNIFNSFYFNLIL